MNNFVVNHFLAFCAVLYALFFALVALAGCLTAWVIREPGMARFYCLASVCWWAVLMIIQCALWALGVR